MKQALCEKELMNGGGGAWPGGARFAAIQSVCGADDDFDGCLARHRAACAAGMASSLGGQVFGRGGGGAAILAPGMDMLAGRHAPPGIVTGVRSLVVSEADIRAVVRDGRTVGWRIEDEGAVYGWFPALKPGVGGAPEAQAEDWFRLLEPTLAAGGFEFRHVARTWFFLDDILGWYDGFNRVRNAYFERAGAFGRFVPASTGVGASNAGGMAVSGDVLCVAPKADGGMVVGQVASPLQCPALDYHSSFSRAVEITGPHGRWLLVSGTASIAPGGQTAHVDDPDAQVALTMDVIHAILESRSMSWRDVWRGVAYFRDPGVRPAWERWRDSTGIDFLPLVPAVCEVCRDDLLFEVELDAFQQA